jgi:uracil-DNA glycosylase
MNREELVAQIVDCERCELHAQCSLPVPFSGQPGPIVVLGEAPGEEEDRVGRPFVGPAGQLLRTLLRHAGLDPESLAYVNTASCFPHGTPSWDHVRSCNQNKWDQIDYLNPTYLLLLGKVALRSIRPDLEISGGRSRPFLHADRICFASYHPSAALRNGKYERGLKRDLDAFVKIVHANDWHTFIPDTCSRCDANAVWWETTGLGWCPDHLPDHEKAAYTTRTRQQADQLDAARRRDHALARVADAADPTWMNQAWDALLDYLKTHQEFFVDDFWSQTQLARPREARALGPVVLRAARKGLMKKSGRFRKSVASNMT